MKINSNKIKHLSKKIDSIKKLDEDELSYELMHLDIEFNTIKKYLKPSEIKLYQDFISLYEQEKQSRKKGKKEYMSYMLGPRSAMASWVEVIEVDMNYLVKNKGDSEEDND